MAALRAIVFASVLAGLAVGLVATLAQQFGTVPLILQAEGFERAAAAAVTAAPHDQEHDAGSWEPAPGLERHALTALFNVLDWIGFGLILTGLLALLRRPVGWREGFLFGLGGFAAFVLAPGLGLPPELPGAATAALTPRQIWWLATALLTATGLWLIAFRPSPLGAAIAILLIAAPHLIGAPATEPGATDVPAGLAHRFVIAVTLTTLLSWALLGGLSGYLYQRFARPLV